MGFLVKTVHITGRDAMWTCRRVAFSRREGHKQNAACAFRSCSRHLRRLPRAVVRVHDGVYQLLVSAGSRRRRHQLQGSAGSCYLPFLCQAVAPTPNAAVQGRLYVRQVERFRSIAVRMAWHREIGPARCRNPRATCVSVCVWLIASEMSMSVRACVVHARTHANIHVQREVMHSM